MLTVFIEGQEVYAPIGWYEEERKLRVRLLITVEVGLNAILGGDQISDTMDYSKLSGIIRDCAAQECKLLETLAERIRDRIMEHQPLDVVKIVVTIKKPHLPEGNYSAESAGISVVYTT